MRAVPRTHKTFGDRSFAAPAARHWNSLPPVFRTHGLIYGMFKLQLKTFFYLTNDFFVLYTPWK